MRISRRDFLGTAAITGATAFAATDSMPTRVLGRTGARVSILAMGGGSRFLMYRDEDKALAALNRAFDLGINYMDTAYSYGNGLSEERVGKVMKDRRKGIFLATKIDARKGDEAQRILEGSLKRLQTDHLDLIHVHSLTDERDLAAVEAPDGVLNVLLKLRDRKVTRFIGITSHTDPAVLKMALERHDFDCTQMALNAARAGMQSGKGGMVLNADLKTSFEDVALPVAREKKMGVIAMKVFAQEALVGQAPAEKLLYYPLSLPGVTLAKAFKALPADEMRQLSGGLAARNKVALDRFFSTHVDA